MIVVWSLEMTTALGLTEIGQGDAVQLDAQLLGDHVAAGQGREVAQHGLAAVTEARRLDRSHLQGVAQAVHDERGQGLAHRTRARVRW